MLKLNFKQKSVEDEIMDCAKLRSMQRTKKKSPNH